jgi:hypothetical protein
MSYTYTCIYICIYRQCKFTTQSWNAFNLLALRCFQRESSLLSADRSACCICEQMIKKRYRTHVAHWGRWSIALLFVILGTGRGWVVSSKLRPHLVQSNFGRTQNLTDYFYYYYYHYLLFVKNYEVSTDSVYVKPRFCESVYCLWSIILNGICAHVNALSHYQI